MGPGCQPHSARIVWFLPLFLPLISGYSTLNLRSLPPCERWDTLLANGSEKSASQHQNRLISSIVFDPWFLSTRLLTFEHFPLINVERHCWLMGPRCQPPYKRIVYFLDYLADFIFDPVRQTTLHADGSRMSASQYKKLLISWLLFTRDIASSWLYFRSRPSNNAAGWWVPEVSLSVQENLQKIQKESLNEDSNTRLPSLKHDRNGALPLHHQHDCI